MRAYFVVYKERVPVRLIYQSAVNCNVNVNWYSALLHGCRSWSFSLAYMRRLMIALLCFTVTSHHIISYQKVRIAAK